MAGPLRSSRSGWLLAWLAALAWAILPLLPSLSRGEISGSRFTDLYPSVWGLDTFCRNLPSFTLHTGRFGAPQGIGFYYSSPLHALAGFPVWFLGRDSQFGAIHAYTAALIGARTATVLCAFGFLRALGRGTTSALGGALLYGASPFFTGFAVEGIVEGTDGWALALWAWMVARQRPAAATVALALTIFSSWYLGMVACAFAGVAGLRWRGAWVSLAGGLALASPALWAFTHSFGGNAPLEPAVRIAMGAPLTIRPPAWLADAPNPFALNTFVGLSAAALSLPAARRNPAFALGALACFVLSTGRGVWWNLPVLELVRFPYRWHAGTLLCLAVLASDTCERVRWSWLGFLPALEASMFSPIPLILPGAPPAVPNLYASVRGPVLLDLPGPVELPPGQPNPSRLRARYLLLPQLVTHASSPWTLDFNGISHDHDAAWLAAFRAYDPLVSAAAARGAGGDGLGSAAPDPIDLAAARTAGCTEILVHRDEFPDAGRALEAALLAAGATLAADENPLALYRF